MRTLHFVDKNDKAALVNDKNDNTNGVLGQNLPHQVSYSHSSLHFNQNTQTINRLKLTEHPFILLSATFPMYFQICLQYLYLLTKVLRMKGG